MEKPIVQSLKELPSTVRRTLPQLWREPLPTLPGSARGVQFPLHPSRVAREGRWLMLTLSCLYLGQLVLLGHLRVAVPAAVAAGAFAWLSRAAPRSSKPARRLLWSADGRLHLLEAGGSVVPVTLQSSSMRLGRWLLLVLRDDAGTRRWLVGPDNLDPAGLAALRRRVAAIPQRPGGTR